MEIEKKSKIHWSSPTAWVLIACFAVSLAALIIYLEESQFPDETLFLLLTVMRYSSFLLCICAFYKIMLNLFRISRDRIVAIVKIFIYLFFLVYGIAVIFLESLIVVIAGGT